MALSLCCLAQFHQTEIRYGFRGQGEYASARLRVCWVPCLPVCPPPTHTNPPRSALFAHLRSPRLSVCLSLSAVDDSRSVPAYPDVCPFGGGSHINNVQTVTARHCTPRPWSTWNVIAGPCWAGPAGVCDKRPHACCTKPTPSQRGRGDAAKL